MGHILNLGASKAISVAVGSKSTSGSDESDLDEDEEDQESQSNVNILQALRRIIKAIKYSPQLLKVLRTKCQSDLQPILDVKTRWNSTWYMIDRALALQRVSEEVQFH